MKTLSGQDNRLFFLLSNNKSFEPGSKTINIGLNKHNPLDALNQLRTDKIAMSVALHEAMHFHSLTNDIGTVFTTLGVLAALTSDDLIFRIKSKSSKIDISLRRYLRIRHYFTIMLTAWTPFLEGLAIFLQTSFPCKSKNAINLPVDNFILYSAGINNLDPTSINQNKFFYQNIDDFLDDQTNGLHSIAYETMMDGPNMKFGKDTLAVVLELENEKWSLPYFFGNAYFRCLQTHLIKNNPEFKCPELFLEFMLRIIQSSAKTILGSSSSWTSSEDIERLYGWIELIKRKPEKVIELSMHNNDINIFSYLRDDKILKTQPTTTTNINQLLKETIPFIWKDLKTADSLSNLIAGVTLQTFSLNISSGGYCHIIGWIPNLFPETSYVALQVNSSVWWMAIDRNTITYLLDDLSKIPILSSDAFQINSNPQIPIDSPTIKLQVECYTNVSGQDLPGTSKLDYPKRSTNPDIPKSTKSIILKFFVHENPQKFVLTYIEPSHLMGRAIIKQVRSEAFHAAEDFRDQMTGAILDLNKLADLLNNEGFHDHANNIRKMIKEEQIELDRLNELIYTRILKGLFGSSFTNEIKHKILNSRLGDPFMNIDSLKRLLTATYSTPRQLEGPGKLDIEAFVESVNERSNEIFSKPMFHYDLMDNISYLGLWGSTDT